MESCLNNLDDTDRLSIQYDENGLIAAIAQDFQTKEILMLAWMNEEAFRMTCETGVAYYWSRSRKSLWKKGETSGALQFVKEIRIDCDQDAVLLLIEQVKEGACHTGRRSCFFRQIEGGKLKFL
jgi:phosphoribosyl-AMP cyclohydrolase